jgi:hypothetical protein
MIRVLPLFCLFLFGCTSTSEYYSPEVDWSDWITVGACGNKFEVYRKNISGGITLEMISPYNILFRLGKDESVQFELGTVKIRTISNEQSIDLNITSIKTGVFPEIYQGIYKIPEKEYEALAKFHGTGSYEKIDMAWGEWSSFKGKRDIFHVALEEHDIEGHPTVEVTLPSFFANGKRVQIDPIVFKWKKGVSLACVQ